MDITIVATVGFTTVAVLAIVYLFVSMRKRK
jgi:hypothetical protein